MATTSKRKTETPQVKKSSTQSIKVVSFSQFTNLKNRRTILIGILLIAAVLSILFIFKGLFIAATVNGEPISRFTIIKELEKQGGRATLENLVTKKLISQEAKKRNIEISQSDIDQELNKITENLKTQGTTIDDVLTAQGMTKAQLNDEIKLQLSIRKMVGDDIKISDKEIDDFVKASKGQFAEDATEEDIRKQSTEQLKQQKLQQKTQEFIKSLQDNAKISNFVAY